MSDLLVKDIRNLIEEVGVDKIKYLLDPKEYKDGLFCFMVDNEYLRCGQALIILSKAKGVYSTLFNYRDTDKCFKTVFDEVFNENA